VCLALPGAAQAEIKFIPQASIDYEHNSNIFAVPAGDEVLVQQGDLQRADTIGTYGIALFVNGNWGQQKLTAILDGREIRYSHYTRLNHQEYLGDVDYFWAIGDLFEGNFDVRRDKRMAQFVNRESTALEVDTTQDETANVNFKVTSALRLEAGIVEHNLKTPLPGFGDSEVNENTERVAVRRLGTGNLSYGLEISRLNGEFKQSVLPSKYNQNNALFVFGYGTQDAVSILNGSIGYSKRQYDGSDLTTSGVTGSIGLTRQVSAKTALKFEVKRQINIYVVGGGTETDTSATLGASWAATGLITVNGGLSYTRASFGQQSSQDSFDAGRTDNYGVADLALNYQVLRWLSIRPYGRYDSRHSNRLNFSFDGTIVGIELKGKFE
jgi:Putative beta-barrel porin 2